VQLICRKKIQLDVTQWFIELIDRSTCFGHYYAHHQQLETIQVITAWGTWHFVESWSWGLVWDCGLCVREEGCCSRKKDVPRARSFFPDT